MELSIYALATFLMGGLMFLFALPMLFASDWFRKELMATAKEKPGLHGLQLYSTLMVFYGLWLLSIEYRLGSGMGWYIIIPIIGYLAILKGITFLWAPKYTEKLIKGVYASNAVMMFAGLLALAFGIILWWLTLSVF